MNFSYFLVALGLRSVQNWVRQNGIWRLKCKAKFFTRCLKRRKIADGLPPLSKRLHNRRRQIAWERIRRFKQRVARRIGDFYVKLGYRSVNHERAKRVSPPVFDARQRLQSLLKTRHIFTQPAPLSIIESPRSILACLVIICQKLRLIACSSRFIFGFIGKNAVQKRRIIRKLLRKSSQQMVQ